MEPRPGIEPINFNAEVIRKLKIRELYLMAELTEVRAEVQRLELGQQPHDLTPIQAPRDRFWRQTIDFNQTRAEQAAEQSDQKQLTTVPYKHLLQ